MCTVQCTEQKTGQVNVKNLFLKNAHEFVWSYSYRFYKSCVEFIYNMSIWHDCVELVCDGKWLTVPYIKEILRRMVFNHFSQKNSVISIGQSNLKIDQSDRHEGYNCLLPQAYFYSMKVKRSKVKRHLVLSMLKRKI